MQQTYTISEAISALRTSRSTLYAEIAAGRLKSYTIGTRRYISREALQEYIRARETEVQQQTAG